MKVFGYWFVFLATLLPMTVQAEVLPTPCEAVERAERYFKEKGIDPRRQHIQNLRRQYDAERRVQYWEINWAWDVARLGSELSARVYPDGRVEWRRLGP